MEDAEVSAEALLSAVLETTALIEQAPALSGRTQQRVDAALQRMQERATRSIAELAACCTLITAEQDVVSQVFHTATADLQDAPCPFESIEDCKDAVVAGMEAGAYAYFTIHAFEAHPGTCMVSLAKDPPPAKSLCVDAICNYMHGKITFVLHKTGESPQKFCHRIGYAGDMYLYYTADYHTDGKPPRPLHPPSYQADFFAYALESATPAVQHAGFPFTALETCKHALEDAYRRNVCSYFQMYTVEKNPLLCLIDVRQQNTHPFCLIWGLCDFTYGDIKFKKQRSRDTSADFFMEMRCNGKLQQYYSSSELQNTRQHRNSR
jgi:hypothetical protein